MATANYVLLEKITVGAAGASSVTFSGIPQTGYTDLVLKASTRSQGAQNLITVSFNGVTTNLSGIYILGNPANSPTASSGSLPPYLVQNQSSYTASAFTNNEIYIPNYASSNYKSISIDGVQEQNATSSALFLQAGLWSSTAAITSITLTDSLNFDANSTFYLYGVAKLGTTPAIVPYATGGDTIMTDGTYWYHAFKSSGTFTPAKGLSCDVLVVAGGGGGGQFGGGGGAGGYLYTTSVSTSSAQTVTIGAGGTATGPADTGNRGGAGSNSVFGSYTATGGAGGGGYAQAALTGGSGGGGAGVTNLTGSSGTSGQGNAGANGTSANGGTPGGGGGAGATGSGQNGGIGLNTLSTWASVTGTGDGGYFAGGGGAGGNGSNGTTPVGTGGTGGGGAGGGASNNGVSGIANTGGGGGGIRGLGSAVSGTGGSGIVIVRYAV